MVVDLKPVEALKKPVTLSDVKSDARLRNMALIRQSRLSVMPVTQDEFDVIVARGKGKL